MKDVWNLMDAIHGKALRPFLVLSIICAGCIYGDYAIRLLLHLIYENTSQVVVLPGTIYVIICIDIIALLVLRIRSQQRFLKHGGLQRMMLLPMKRSVYILEEVLFTLMSICIQLIGIYIAVGMIYLTHGWVFENIEYGFLYMILSNSILGLTILPVQGIQFWILLMMILLLTMLYTTLALSLGNGYYLISTVMISIGLSVLLTFVQGLVQASFNEFSKVSFAMILLACSSYLYYRMQKAFTKGELGG